MAVGTGAPALDVADGGDTHGGDDPLSHFLLGEAEALPVPPQQLAYPPSLPPLLPLASPAPPRRRCRSQCPAFWATPGVAGCGSRKGSIAKIPLWPSG